MQLLGVGGLAPGTGCRPPPRPARRGCARRPGVPVRPRRRSRLQPAGHRGGRVGAGEHQVAALDVGPHRAEPALGRQLSQLRHRQRRSAADVDTAQQGHIHRHRPSFLPFRRGSSRAFFRQPQRAEPTARHRSAEQTSTVGRWATRSRATPSSEPGPPNDYLSLSVVQALGLSPGWSGPQRPERRSHKVHRAGPNYSNKKATLNPQWGDPEMAEGRDLCKNRRHPSWPCSCARSVRPTYGCAEFRSGRCSSPRRRRSPHRPPAGRSSRRW